MSALDRKLLRDLWRLRGQVIAIALVIASGIGVLVMSLSAMRALEETADAYYERYRFAQVFATLKRAPERLRDRIAAIPGVRAVDTRVVKLAVLDVPGFAEPVIGQLVSIPERGEAPLNRLALRSGRLVAPGRPDEAVLSEPFAAAQGLRLGDHLFAIINGRKRRLQVVGLALSPEYVYAIGPGSILPDDARFGVLWMGRDALAAAYDLDSAFNDVALSLLRGARPEDVIDRLDDLLAPYGGTGAVERKDQVSNWYLSNEIEQLKTMSAILPTIFLAVAVFLTNVVLNRLIATERGEIGLLKAFGYGNLAVAWHYAKLVIAMTAIGIALGWAVGLWLSRVNAELYAEFYHFPFLLFRPDPAVFAAAAVISLGAALAGTARAVRQAAALAPAEAMRPPAPPLYRRTRLSRTRFGRRFDEPTRIILRQIGRWPLRSFLSSAGIAMSVAVLVTSMQWIDAIDHMIEVYFFQGQHQDMTVGLVEARSSRVVHEMERLPGVLAAEPSRAVSARLRAGHRSRREALRGVVSDARLQPIYDASGAEVSVPDQGLVLSTKLAKVLGVGRGDRVTVEVLEGRRPVASFPVVGLFETYIGTPAYLDSVTLQRLMREGPSVNAVNLAVDPDREAALFAALKELPQVSAVTLRRAAVDSFHETMGKTLMIYVSFFVAFSCALAFGVVYNGARIALSERGRELATLRVLGFTRGEISYILLGEVALITFVALPLGCLAGRALAWIIVGSFDTELFRVPLATDASTFGIAALIGLGATAVAAGFVRRRLDRLDLVAVLKTRE